MPEITLVAEPRHRTGSRPSGRLRAAGKVPGVIYGHGLDPIAVAVDARELRHALNTDAGVNALLNLQVDGTSHLTLARDLQRDPVRNVVVHVDFLVVRRDEVVSADVPVVLTGDAIKVRQGDGVVDQQLFSLTVQATPAEIPASFEVDIGAIAIGDAIRVGDLRLPAGVTTDVDAEEPVVVGQGAQKVEAIEVAEAEVSEREQAEAEGQPAQAPAREG
jgi:large subunit ribosomal protein L25